MKKTRLLVSTVLAIAAAGFTAMAGIWKNDARGWWYDQGNGSYPKSTWSWIDGNNDGVSECYYFDADGYCLINTTTPDGYNVDPNGAWVVNGVVQTKVAEAENTGAVQSATWKYIMPKVRDNITFDGSSFHIIADDYYHSNNESYRQEYILDADTTFEFTFNGNVHNYLPKYQEGDTAYQWYTRFYNEDAFWHADVYKVKVTGNHIDAISDITSAY